jgi:hypothetical protein
LRVGSALMPIPFSDTLDKLPANSAVRVSEIHSPRRQIKD